LLFGEKGIEGSGRGKKRLHKREKDPAAVVESHPEEEFFPGGKGAILKVCCGKKPVKEQK